MLTTGMRYADSFDFSDLTDADLRVTFDLWATDNAPSGDWVELYAAGRAAIIEEAHRRALGIRKYEITITCYSRHSSTGASWGDYETFVGTTPEFMERFGLRSVNDPYRAQGDAVGRSANGEQVTLEWQRL